jgi:hypothetical protein
METFFILLSVLQSIGISLGVGASTIAITSFFIAIVDKTITPEERKMLGVIYVILRVAMVLILTTTAALALLHSATETGVYLTSFSISQWVLISVLFINALLMTKRIMPSNFGPAIQAGSWYTLGITAALVPLGLAEYSLLAFCIGYLTALAFAVVLVNAIMTYLKSKQRA